MTSWHRPLVCVGPPMNAPIAQFSPLRVNLTGYGPKIIIYVGSEDLSDQTCVFYGAGPPSADTLAAGNGEYLGDDLYIDEVAHTLHLCISGGTNETSNWTQISGGGVVMFKITGLFNGDFVWGQRWDGTTLSPDIVKIAKAWNTRHSLVSENIDGIDLTYAYTDDNSRTATGAGITQKYKCYPRYFIDAGDNRSIILASPMTTGVLVDGQDVGWLETSWRGCVKST